MQHTEKYQQDTTQTLQVHETSIKNLKYQMGQISYSLGRLKSQQAGKLPSQTVINPKENVNAVTLRSGKEIEIPQPLSDARGLEEQPEKELEILPKDHASSSSFVPKVNSSLPDATVTNVLPLFPHRLCKSKKEDKEKEILEVFCKVEINIPLIDAIRQVSRYAKFLKDLCTTRRKLKGNE